MRNGTTKNFIDACRCTLAAAMRAALGDDCKIAAGMMVAALLREAGNMAEGRLQAAALALPEGSTAAPRVARVEQQKPAGTIPEFRVIFSEGEIQYKSQKEFLTREQAERYGNKFLLDFSAVIAAGGVSP